MRTALNAAKTQPSLILICILSIALGFSIAANLYHQPTTAPAIAAPAVVAPSDWRTVFEDVAAKLAPSVVNIRSEKTVKTSEMPDMGDFFNFGPFSMPRRGPSSQTQRATGTGVIVRSDGYILTNDHVVGGADRVTVKLVDGREFKGTVLRDPNTDLALVKIDVKDLPAAQFSDSGKARVGQWVMAIGNPFMLYNTVTVGVISAVRHDTPDPDTQGSPQYPYPEVIQTDASINPGNSGGPLVDLDGKILGINGAIATTSGGNVGIGFAIPSNTAKYVMDQLITKGKVVRGYLGLRPVDLTPILSGKLGAKKGALVESVDKDSPADKHGILVKDVITKVNGKEILDAVDLRHTVQSLAPGTTAKVVIVRDKKEKTLEVKLGEAPNVDKEGNEVGDEADKTGLSVLPLTPDMAKQLGLDESVKGVVVRSVESGSAAERAGIRAKDVITEMDDTPITSVAGFSKAAIKLKSGDTSIIVVQRGERSVIVEMPID